MDYYRRSLIGLPLREQVLKLEAFYEIFFIFALDEKYDPERVFRMIASSRNIRGTLGAFEGTWPEESIKYIDDINRSTRDNAYETVTSFQAFAKKAKKRN